MLVNYSSLSLTTCISSVKLVKIVYISIHTMVMCREGTDFCTVLIYWPLTGEWLYSAVVYTFV